LPQNRTAAEQFDRLGLIAEGIDLDATGFGQQSNTDMVRWRSFGRTMPSRRRMRRQQAQTGTGLFSWLSPFFYRHQRNAGLLLRIQARARAAPRYLGLSMHGSRNSHCVRDAM